MFIRKLHGIFWKVSEVDPIFLHFCPSEDGEAKGGVKNNQYLYPI